VGVGDERCDAVDDPVATLEPCPQIELVRAPRSPRDGGGRPCLAARQLREPALLVGGGTASKESAGAEDATAQKRARREGAAELDQNDRQLDKTRPCASE